MKNKYIVFLLLIFIGLSACSNKSEYKVATSGSEKMPEYKNLNKIYSKYSDLFGKNNSLKLMTNKSYLFTNNYKMILDSAFDMAIIANTNFNSKDTIDPTTSKIKSVLPINSRIFYIIYNKDHIQPNSINDLFEGKRVAILSNEISYVKHILTDLGVNVNKINLLYNKSNLGSEDTNKMDSISKDSISKIDYYNYYKENKILPYDIEIGFASQNYTSSARLYKLLDSHKDLEFYSFDDHNLFKNGSKAEGFCLRNKFFTPFLLAKGAFGEHPKLPVLTIREDFILAARADLDETFIYNFVKTAIEETDLIDLKIYGSNFENITFAYRLHEGTKRYLDKNAPTFYERYGELLAKMGAGIGGLYTALMGFLLWRKKRRRRTLSYDYERILEIQKKIGTNLSKDDLEDLFNELQVIENYYHLKMIDQKILVDESLQIFFVTIDKIEGYILKELKRFQN